MKYHILNQIQKNYLVAVVRSVCENDAYNISKKIIEGGINTIELTFSTPFVENAIEKLSKDYQDSDNILIGAGTVMDDITARIAIMKGAKFIVSPHFDANISKICNRYMIPYLPGCGSITEVVSAIESGCDVVKLFPGNLLGPGFIKDIKGPLPYVQAMPSGGVNIENMDKWIEAGAYAIGIGSALTKELKSKGYDSVREITQKFVTRYLEIKKRVFSDPS
ncbi:2-dehydro-3-deoxyphosphogluconate aldolase [Fusobacterium necrophorum DAB]|uniref:bifunctional 2-keto-4-hydroxyglutarate aldolase/2-keto-3-deoxy-6-phosphogluconate aldolase n=1 Tax=Fusobacterium necrophorum TaxID=859 RepID=UPI000461F64D|nr:bifunctional 2-keto-4-hydroxyglutarate aldolase/2-keto-3-deoxy-6-phosphogluconate aldolase [Fusobacterium necrophorum]KDE71086.1 2-dehydro-3-deoxyphosphogluconate aldolase [Fusobacterium necrophorum DAB]